jgi:hypothetical protein
LFNLLLDFSFKPNGLEMSSTNKLNIPILDPNQLVRIESVHRGFLYQHLYTVGCMFMSVDSPTTKVVVEADEDIELISVTQRVYLQIKTRSKALMPSDIADILVRFDLLRAEHHSRNRAGSYGFIIVANQNLGPTIKKNIKNKSIPPDITFQTPEGIFGSKTQNSLPPAWNNIEEGVSWCAEQANSLPLSTVFPETLVWKLSGLVQLAASGGYKYEDHTFNVKDFSDLFEQLFNQMQEFPTPLDDYKPQVDEPDFYSDERVRIICGFSGAGKTSWAAQTAMHSCEFNVYFDVGDMPSSSVCATLVREVSAKLVTQNIDELKSILYPGASGIDSMMLLDNYLKKQNKHSVIVIDNSHRLLFDSLKDLLNATSFIKFILLCQPKQVVDEIEVNFGLQRESLRGWSIDTIAGQSSTYSCAGTILDYDNLKSATGALPLYVRSALKVIKSEYTGNISEFCLALNEQTTIESTAQELILARSINVLPKDTRDILAILSISDIQLSFDDIKVWLKKSLKLSPRSIVIAVKQLKTEGIIQNFGRDKIKIHDAARIVGLQHLDDFDESLTLIIQTALKDLLFASLINKRDISKLSLFARTSAALGEIETLVGISSDEMFHEMGVLNEVLPAIRLAISTGKLSYKQQFWALDSLVYTDIRQGTDDGLVNRLSEMEALVKDNNLGDEEKNSLYMKLLLVNADIGNTKLVKKFIHKLSSTIKNGIRHDLIYRYTVCIAWLKLGENKKAIKLIPEIVNDYYKLLGITADEVMGKNSPDLWEMIIKSDDNTDDLKHLADSLEVSAKIDNNLNRFSLFKRINSMKFYNMIGAVDSLIRVGQDLADEFIGIHDFIGAKQVMVDWVIPSTIQENMLDKIISVRSQYAVILAYCGEFPEAENEFELLKAYVPGMSTNQRLEIHNQKKLVAKIKVNPLIPSLNF